jgi:pSer/pThr/pTyr-binding forkhead associated (FHA) protein
VGRTPDNDVQIRSKFISRHHAQVVSDTNQSVIEDLNSTNGVFIRSQRVKHHVLADGDVIQLGEHKLLYRNLRGTLPQRIADDMDDDEDELDDEDDFENELDDESEVEEEEIENSRAGGAR